MNVFILTCVEDVILACSATTHTEEIAGKIPTIRLSKASPLIFSLSTKRYQRYVLAERNGKKRHLIILSILITDETRLRKDHALRGVPLNTALLG